MSVPEAPHPIQDYEVYNDSTDMEKKAYPVDPRMIPLGTKNLGKQAGTLMVAENISLGILSLPSAVATLGIIPAFVIIMFLSAISWYTGYTMGQFKQRYPQVHSMGDAGELLLGPIGREIFFVGQLLFIIFLMASHILTFSVLFNTITNHGTCTIVFGVVGLVVSCVAALPRTAEKVFWMSIISAISILVATIVTMISIGVQAPSDVQNDIVATPTFQEGFLAVTNIVFAFIAHVSFFGIMSEMQDPRDFPKALAMLQVIDTTMYVVTAMVIYCYAGPTVESPALSSAGPIMKKVAYGLAIPTVIVAGVVFGHVACKYIYVRIFRGDRSHHMHQKTFLATGTWVAIGLTTWTVAWVIAESIPVFNELLSLISALFGSWFSYGLPAIFWFMMNKGKLFSSTRKIALTIINLAILGIACTICGLGLYVSGVAINESSSNASWTCANNAT